MYEPQREVEDAVFAEGGNISLVLDFNFFFVLFFKAVIMTLCYTNYNKY